MVAGSCTNEYQGCPLPSKHYRALPWWLVTVVNDTNLKEAYRRKPWKFRVSWRIGQTHDRVLIGTTIATNRRCRYVSSICSVRQSPMKNTRVFCDTGYLFGENPRSSLNYSTNIAKHRTGLGEGAGNVSSGKYLDPPFRWFEYLHVFSRTGLP